MLTFRRASAITAGVVFVLTTLSGTMCSAAKKATHSASGRVSVPAAIVKGSSVGGARAFYSPRLPEDTLAGIRLGRPAKEILSKWGNPSRITVGMSQSQGPDQNGPTPSSIPYVPPAPVGTGAFGGGLASGVNQAAAMLGLQNPPIGGGAPPGLPGLPGYGIPGAPPAPGQPQTGNVTTVLTEEEVTWTYDLQGGITLEFIITDGLVTQITVGGQGPWGLSRTRTGLQLGDTYKLVLWVCGYPENQRYAGRFLRASYVNKSRALYTFLNKKLVGVTIAMVPQELQ